MWMWAPSQEKPKVLSKKQQEEERLRLEEAARQHQSELVG